MSTMEHDFDFNGAADVFTGGGRIGRRLPMAYRRFATGAEAIRFAIERQALEKLPATVIEVDEVRLAGTEIRDHYESTRYPLSRGKPT